MSSPLVLLALILAVTTAGKIHGAQSDDIRITELKKVSEDAYQLRIAAPYTGQYDIEVSTDTRQWTALATTHIDSPGEHVLIVESQADSGFFRVLCKQPNPPQELSVPQTIHASLSRDDRRDPEFQDVYIDDYFLTGLTVGQTVKVEITSQAFVPDIELFDANSGEWILEEDFDWVGHGYWLTFIVQPGVDYLIRASSELEAETGDYTLATSSRRIETIAVPQTIHGSLAVGDWPDPDLAEEFSDDYLITGISAGQMIRVEFSNAEYYQDIEVLDASNGEWIEEEDFDWTDDSYWLTFKVKRGKSYVIRVFGEIGAYALHTSIKGQGEGESLSKPMLVAPARGGENIQRRPQFEWLNLPNAVGYHLRVIRKNDPSLVRDYEVSAVAAAKKVFQLPDTLAPLAANRIHLWQVRGINRFGEYGPWSAQWSFKTAPELPGVPALIQPANGATGVPRNPLFEWTPAERAVRYHLKVTRKNDPTVVRDYVVSGTSFRVPDNKLYPYNRAFLWQVRAESADGTLGNWSEERSFRTREEPPAAPNLVRPTNGREGLKRRPAFEWTRVGNAVSYHLRIIRKNDTSLVRDYDIPANVAGNVVYRIPDNLPQLAANRIHLWQVRSKDQYGSYGQWSVQRSFKTQK